MVAKWQALDGGPLLIVIGEVLLVLCSLFYLLWWTVMFRPSARTSSGGGIFLAGAAFGGLGGLVLLALGIAAVLPKASSLAVGMTIVGGVAVGALLLWLTSSVAHRPVTTELPLIVVWATAQLAAGIALRTAGVLTVPVGSAWIAATAVATLVGLACYLVFYRLDPLPAYWIGMTPLATDGVVAAALAAIVAFGRIP